MLLATVVLLFGLPAHSGSIPVISKPLASGQVSANAPAPVPSEAPAPEANSPDPPNVPAPVVVPASAAPHPKSSSLSSLYILPLRFRAEGPLPATPKRGWAGLLLAQHSAAAFDAWSTRRAISRGRAEADPLMAPFAHSAAIYGAIRAAPSLLDYFGRRMQRSPRTWERRLWWLPQSVATVGFLFSGGYNLSHTP